ncbi:pentapeptide repeat-containing protein [Bradyrhizobium sp. BR 10289]|uniref:pentapeptide repeat-containing protein n=1 Tax=Bradyrhizobium sp. BR 10289 TaxID=2749993 RepID=UPI001C6454D6|nr:pentapeptide repeat-containing protein [Bradyrhizobium sp. BR 10289]MBW7972106.1 pentapeptide repeat-containing protein [Bradyrhizobium sp. BR 10289]
MGPDTLFSSLDPYHATMAVPAASDEARIAKLREKSENLDAIKKAVEDAAAVGTPLWVSYLFLLLYIAIASAAVTHTDLLLERPVDLPFLNIKLPLKAFFILAPLLFLISHTYTMAHFALLSDKAKHFHLQLRKEVPDPSGHGLREGLRRQLPINIFVQFLAGPEEIREGPFSVVLWATAWTTLVAAPVCLLLLLQLQFLPYHDSVVTWWHRFAVLFDLAIIQWLWMHILSGRSQEDGQGLSPSQGHPTSLVSKIRDFLRWRNFKTSFLSFSSMIAWPIIVAIALFSCWIATFPSEWERFPYYRLASLRWQSANEAVFGTPDVTHEGKIEWPGSLDAIAPEIRPARWPFNTLHLRQLDLFEALKIDDPAKVQSKKYLVDLRKRRLEQADLAGAKLPRVNLDGASMHGANLSAVDMAGSSFEQAVLDDASLRGGNFPGASFVGASLRGANMDYGRFPATSFARAKLQGVSAYQSKLVGSRLTYAHLEGARFVRASLTTANLASAHLHAANFDEAQLYAASLARAHLDGTSFRGSNLAGARLILTDGKSPDFTGARLWRSNWDASKIQLPEFKESTFQSRLWKTEGTWADESYTAALASVKLGLTDLQQREDAIKSIALLVCEHPVADDYAFPYQLCQDDPRVAEHLARWQSWMEEVQAKDTASYRGALVTVISDLVCPRSTKGAVYIVRGMINQGWPARNTVPPAPKDEDDPPNRVERRPLSRLSALEDGTKGFVERITQSDCAVSHSLTADDMTALNEAINGVR